MRVKVIRSARRVRTISAIPQGNVLVVRAPEHVSNRDLKPIIEDLRERWLRVKKPSLSNPRLQKRAELLNRQYFGGRLRWRSIRWVTNQRGRFGSCTPEHKTIRVSSEIASMPSFVRDYIIVHELAHLIEDNHGPRFWKLVNRYPFTERARGYLLALEADMN